MGKSIAGAGGRGSKGEGTGPGRPAFVIDDEKMQTLIGLAEILCTREEAAHILQCHEDTIENVLQRDHGMTWVQFLNKHGANKKAALRRAQFKSAVDDGNTTMQIWLGKQLLGQKDKHEHGFDPEQPAVFKVSMGKQLTEGEQPDGKDENESR